MDFKNEKTSLKIFTDGGSRGNPGPAGVGFLVKNGQGETLVKAGKYIGETTNNMAEYRAVIEALKWLKQNFSISQSRLIVEDPRRSASGFLNFSINFFIDSQLIVKQLNGLYKVKNARLRNLIIEVRGLEGEIKLPIHYHYIPREKNKEADRLVNQALDCQRGDPL